jgi:hypothetical protein
VVALETGTVVGMERRGRAHRSQLPFANRLASVEGRARSSPIAAVVASSAIFAVASSPRDREHGNGTALDRAC